MKALVVAIMIGVVGGRVLAAPGARPATAEELFTQGQHAFDKADWPTAIAKWQLSYDLSGAVGLLFNLAQAHRNAGHCAIARGYYRRFVELDPKSDKRELADDFIRELELACGDKLPLVDRSWGDDRRTFDPPRKPGRTLKVAGLVTGGAGALSFVIGLGVGHHASTLGDEVAAACSIAHPCDWQTLEGKDAAGRRDSVVGYTLDMIGIAAIGGGAIMYYFGDRKDGIALAPQPHEGGVVVTWSGSW